MTPSDKPKRRWPQSYEAQVVEAQLREAWSSREQGHTADLARLRASQARLLEALQDYGAHEASCLMSQWHEGRPTKDGGYETRYGDKWYPRGTRPPCSCGLDAAIAAAIAAANSAPPADDLPRRLAKAVYDCMPGCALVDEARRAGLLDAAAQS